jgi:hypothetical protein
LYRWGVSSVFGRYLTGIWSASTSACRPASRHGSRQFLPAIVSRFSTRNSGWSWSGESERRGARVINSTVETRILSFRMGWVGMDRWCGQVDERGLWKKRERREVMAKKNTPSSFWNSDFWGKSKNWECGCQIICIIGCADIYLLSNNEKLEEASIKI